MKPLLYLETTIPSYLTSRPSRDLIVAARQRLTTEWWLKRRVDFRIFVSQIVLDEAAEGDRMASAARLSIMDGLPLLAVNDEVISLTQTLLRRKRVAQEGDTRCRSYRRICDPRRAVLADVELHASGQCGDL